MIFSRRFKTYEDWFSGFNGSESYRTRIIREHSRFPNASLTQLRGHASRGKKPVSELKEIPIYKRSWTTLNKRELSTRKRSLKVLTNVKAGRSLTGASRESHISTRTVLRNTNAFKKLKGKWIAKQKDRISRTMSIYENGQQDWIEVRDSRTASRIGEYNNAVKEFLTTGNVDILKNFKKPLRDAQGKLHYLEIDPDKLTEIMEAQEDIEFFEIYKV